MRALFNETNLETLKKVMDINFWGTVYCTKYALPHILKQQGTIVGVSSIAGYRGFREEQVIVLPNLQSMVF
jgi:NAD(P)-dependent dehydrogenase (short-subunit alcohol dehydrogenase family)